jgi:hypothetical protein
MRKITKLMCRSAIIGLLSGGIGLIGITQAFCQQLCKPKLEITEANFSGMQKPTLERKWTAVVTIDTSRCAANSGKFEIGFERLKENGPDVDFREEFEWVQRSVTVSVKFSADEAVAHYWIDRVEPCPCAR